jgi:Lipocalin-like domain
MKNKVVGMWRPETIQSTLNGEMMEPFGPKPSGLLCFHESMRFVELMSDPSVAHYASGSRESGTAEEDKAAMVGNLALFGTYTVDADGNFTGNTVEGCTFPNWIGDHRTADQLKEIVDSDRMLEIFQNGDVRVEIHWQRISASQK